MIIRNEMKSDVEAISEVTKAAFKITRVVIKQSNS